MCVEMVFPVNRRLSVFFLVCYQFVMTDNVYFAEQITYIIIMCACRWACVCVQQRIGCLSGKPQVFVQMFGQNYNMFRLNYNLNINGDKYVRFLFAKHI